MTIKTLKLRAKAAKNDTKLPMWVSVNNLSLPAYQCINQLKIERLNYIETHNKSIDYKKKSLFQINASEVARIIGCATPTLINTSAYSPKLKIFLDQTNLDLEQEKKKKLNTHAKTLSLGLKQHRKDQLLVDLQKANLELKLLKQANALQQAKEIINSLSLPIKQKLGINL
jgi:hypothetical protein